VPEHAFTVRHADIAACEISDVRRCWRTHETQGDKTTDENFFHGKPPAIEKSFTLAKTVDAIIVVNDQARPVLAMKKYGTSCGAH
jgi:hypothetical protein